MRAFWSLVNANKHSKPLKGWTIIGVQHLLPSTGDLLRAFADSGASPQNIMMNGKVYSANPFVVEELQQDGFQIRDVDYRNAGGGSHHTHHLESNDAALKTFLQGKLRFLPEGNRLLLIDDGARMIKLIHEHFPEYAHKIVAVEQTTKGLIELATMKLQCPVINVAGSWAKRSIEGPLIGYVVGQSVERKLSQLKHAGVHRSRKVLILGYGAVGQEIARHFIRRGYAVSVFDTAPDKAKEARKAGMTVFDSLDAALPNGDIVISATGKTAIRAAEMLQLPDGALLFSAGSADTEFDPIMKQVFPRSKGDDTRIIDGNVSHSFHSSWIKLGNTDDSLHQDDVYYLPNGKQIFLANNGFPINFSGDGLVDHPRYFQLTRGLLFAAAMQAVNTTTPGVHDLAMQPQRDLVAKMKPILSKIGINPSIP